MAPINTSQVFLHPVFQYLAIAIVLIAMGCRKSPDTQTPELKAVDVSPALVIDTENDQQEVERPPELIGILPTGFPEDLPLYLPASLVNFGKVGERRHYAAMLTSHSRGRVEEQLLASLRQQGWTASPVSGGEATLRKGNRQVQLRIEKGNPGTRYRFEYEP